MGIPDCEVRALADLSKVYFRKHGRPLRIAVDEAGWRFKNLTDEQVRFIRSKEPRANPIEKAIMWRLLRIMRLNIQLIFIFDGPGRPWKRGGTAGRIDYDKIHLLVQLLDRLRIPHHRAPAEAEAECARLQQAGIVDAVWSDDADALMFGCTMLIRDHRPADAKKNENKKDVKLVQVFEAERIKEKFGLDQPGLLLFVLLVGGDYEVGGLTGCGSAAALKAVQYNSGSLAHRLWNTPVCQGDLNMWALELQEYFDSASTRRLVQVPPGWPRQLVFKNYRNPKVSAPGQLLSPNGLRRGWILPIDEAKLRSFFKERFNMWTKGYLKHVCPALLARSFGCTGGQEKMNQKLDIKIVPRRGKAATQDTEESKIIFSPHQVSTLDLMTQPRDLEDWTELKGEKKGAAFDPLLPIETELPAYLLEKGLGQSAYGELVSEASKPQSRKRKSNNQTVEDDQEPEPISPSRPKKSKTSRSPETTEKVPRISRQKKMTNVKEVSIGVLARSSIAQPGRPGFRIPTGWSPTSSQSSEISSLSSQNQSQGLNESNPPGTPPCSARRAHLVLPSLKANFLGHSHSSPAAACADIMDLCDNAPEVDDYSGEDDDDPNLAEAKRLSLLDATTARSTRATTSFPDLTRETMSRGRLDLPLTYASGPGQHPSIQAASNASPTAFDRHAIALARIAQSKSMWYFYPLPPYLTLLAQLQVQLLHGQQRSRK